MRKFASAIHPRRARAARSISRTYVKRRQKTLDMPNESVLTISRVAKHVSPLTSRRFVMYMRAHTCLSAVCISSNRPTLRTSRAWMMLCILYILRGARACELSNGCCTDCTNPRAKDAPLARACEKIQGITFSKRVLPYARSRHTTIKP